MAWHMIYLFIHIKLHILNELKSVDRMVLQDTFSHMTSVTTRTYVTVSEKTCLLLQIIVLRYKQKKPAIVCAYNCDILHM